MSTSEPRRVVITRSSATRRWPRSTRSSTHSLLPMPLCPVKNRPTPTTPAGEAGGGGGGAARGLEAAGRERVPAPRQIEHALALADAALPREEQADAEHVGERAVERGR